MPTELDEPKATTTPDAGDSTIPAGGVDDGGGPPAESTDTPPDPLTAGLEEGLELAEDQRRALQEPTGTKPDTTTPALPKGLTVDAEGRWRTADGKFAEKQPSEQAAASAKAETEKLARVADFKAKGLNEQGNRPWTPNIYGQVKAIIPGALESPGRGIWIPEAQRGALTALVARGEKWHEVQATRQEHAAALEREQQRTQFYADQFADIMQSTLLSPKWMERATKDEFTYETAKQQVENRLRAAMVDAKEKFGAVQAKAAGDTTVPVPPPDRYDAQSAIDSFLDEKYPGIDKPAVLAILSAQDGPEVLRHFPEHGWQLDERPMHLVARYIQSQKPAAPVPTPGADPATTRNKAAVPQTPVRAAVAAARPKATSTPDDPRNDPKYADEPWKNPALSFAEQRELFYSKGLKIRVPQ